MSDQHKPPYEGTRLRPVRVDDELWEDSGQAALELGTDRSAAMREALRELVRRVRHERAG